MSSTRHPLDLNPAQEALRQQLLAAAEPFRLLPWTPDGYLIGTLIQPPYKADGWVDVPERRYNVRFSPGYGVICQNLCTSNGSAAMVAACALDANEENLGTRSPLTVFVPV